MKKSILLTTLTIFSNFGYANSESSLQWASSNLWQAPYYNSFEVSLINSTDDLKKECAMLKNIVFDSRGQARVWKKEQMTLLRTNPSASQMAQSFSADFFVDIKPYSNLLSESQIQQLSSISELSAKEDPMPFYTQKTTEVRLDLLAGNQITPVFHKGSLSEVSLNLGLQSLAVRFINKENGLYVRVLGKDTACDLLDGKANLNVETYADVKISLEQQMQLIKFYNRIEDVYANEQTRNRSQRARTFAFSYAITKMLDSMADLSEEQKENIHEKVMLSLFKENFDLSDVWTIGSQGAKFNVDGTVKLQNIYIKLTTQKK